MTSLTLDLGALVTLTDEQFYKLCRTNRDLRFERTAAGELIVMSPAGSKSGNRNASLTSQVWIWNKQTGSGKVFDSSTGFRLQNKAIRSPDVAWVELERWNALTAEQQEKFAPLCPDFVIELRSMTDELKPLQLKMQEYLDNGLRLGWLIDPQTGRVEIYRPEAEIEVVQSPAHLSGEEVLPGFVLSLCDIL